MSVHIGRPWVSISTHMTTHISTLVLGISTLGHPVDCLGDFGPHGLSVQYTQDVPGFSPAHTGRPWMSVSTHKTSVCVRQHTQVVRGYPCVSVSTHKTSVAVHPYTYQHVGPWTQHADPSHGLFGTSVAVRVCPCVSVCVHQHTQDVRGCLSAHIGRPWLSVCVRVFPSAHTGRSWLSISTHISTLFFGLSTLALPVDSSGDFGPRGTSVQVILANVGCLLSTHMTSVAVHQHTQDIHGCPCVSVYVRVSLSAHTGRLWLSISTHISTLVLGLSTLALPVNCSGDFGPRGLSVQYTQDIRGCPSANTGRPCVSVSTHRSSVAVRVCPSAHTGRLWLSISTHISTLLLGLSTLTLPVDCSGDFGPCGLSVQYTQDVRGYPSAHTGRSCVSVSTHRTSVAVHVCPCVSVSTHRTSVDVRQHTQDVRVCPSAHTGRPWLSVCVRQHTQDVRGCPSVHISARWTSVAVRVCPCVSVCVRQHTQDVRGCLSAHIGRPWLSVCVRVFPSAHTGRSWLSISTHISTLFFGLSTLALPVDSSGDFGPRGTSVQVILANVGCLLSTHMTSVAVHQHTQDIHGCPCVSVYVRVSLSAHTGRLWLSISTHISTLVLGLSTLALPVDCSGDFGPRGLSVQYTQDIRGCPSANTGRPCVSVSTHRSSVTVRVCPSAHTGRLWLSISTHISTLLLGLSTLTLPVDCSGDFGPCGLSVQYTQDVPHTGRPWLSISTHISTLVLELSTLAHPVDCLDDFGPRGLFVQYTQDVRGCPPAHTGRPWLSVSTHRTSVAVRVCPCVSVSTHRTFLAVHHTHMTSVGVRQHAHDVRDIRGCPSVHISARWSLESAHIGNPVDCWGDVAPRGLSVQYTQDVCGCPPAHTGRPCVSVSTHRTSMCVRQHTQVVRGCSCVSVSTHRTSVAVHQYTYQHAVQTERPSVSASTHRTSVAVRVCPCVSVNTHRTFLAVHQYTYQHAVPWTQHTGPSRGLFGMSVAIRVCVRVCPSAHTGHPWLSISTHISTLVLGISTLGYPVDCLGDVSPRGLSVQYTQDVRGCPPAHTERLWVTVSTHRTSVCVRQHTQVVRGCPCVSVSTHRTSVAVHLYTYQHAVHTERPWVSASTHRTSVAVRVCPCVFVNTHRTFLAVHQYTYQHAVPWTQHTGPSRGLFGTSVAVCVCVWVFPSTHTGHTWLSISTHISTLVLGISTLGNPVDCLGDVAPRGLSVQYTQDVCGCPPAHTGRPCVSVSTHRTSMCVRQHTQVVRGCSCVSVSTHRTSYKQNVRGCPPAHTGRPWLFVCVRVFPSTHTGRSWLSISTHISTLFLGLSTLALPVDSSGDFGPRGMSVQYTQDVRGCPTFVAVHVCPCVSVSTHRTFLAVQQYTYQHAVLWTQHTGPSRGLFGTSVAVRVCVREGPSAHTGHPWLSISTHISTLVLGISTLGNPVDCLGDVAPRGLSVQYTQDVRGTKRTSVAVRVCVRVCPSAHTGHPWLSISTHISTLVLGISTLGHPVDCLGDFGPRGLSVQYTLSGGVRQHTQDVCGCPSAHTGRPCVSVSTHSTLVLRLSTLALPMDCSGDFGPRGLSVQYTQNVCGCPPAHTGRLWLFVCVRVFPSEHTGRSWLSNIHTGRPWVSVSTHMTFVCVRQHIKNVRSCPCVSVSTHTGHPWLSISTHISTLVLGISMLGYPVDCLGDVSPRGLSVQYTQDVRGCPPAHTGRPWVSVSTHRTSVCVCHTLVLRLSTLALPVDCSGDFGPRGLSVQYKQNVRGCPPAHTGRPWQFVCVRVFPSTHTGRSWLSISTHISTLFLGLRTLALPVDSSGDFGPRGMSVQYTQDVRRCPTYVAVHKYTYQHVGPWNQHAGPSRGLFGCFWPTWAVCSVHTGRPWVSASTHRTSVGVCQHTQDVCVCPSAHTGRPWLSVCVRVCPSAHTRRPWLSIRTHISTLVLGLSTLTLPVDCSGDFSPHGLSVQYTQNVCGCPAAHTGHLWLFVCVRVCPSVSVSTHRTFVAYTQDVRGCPPAQTGRLWLSMAVRRTWLFISTHISTLVLGLSMLALPVDCSGDFGPSGLSVQYTQDARVCPSAHTERSCVSVRTHRTSVAVRVCLCVSVSTHRTSVAVHQYTYHNVGPWTQHTDPSRGLFG
ncbi:hypothetical protein YC2023_108576 [Brassica napus]